MEEIFDRDLLNRLSDKVHNLQAENKRLRKALKKYGRHISCACCHTLVNRRGKWVAAKCDCGLEQALKEVE